MNITLSDVGITQLVGEGAGADRSFLKLSRQLLPFNAASPLAPDHRYPAASPPSTAASSRTERPPFDS